MHKIIDSTPGHVKNIIVNREGESVAQNIDLRLHARHKIKSPLSMFNIEQIFCRKIITARSNSHVQENRILMNDVILKLNIGVINVGLDMISALIIRIVDIATRKL